MGTRNLTCAVLDGEYKVANYGQWDGYPSGVGVVILKFLREKMNRPILEEKLRKITFLNDDDFKIINEMVEDPKQFSRDVGGDIFEFIQEGVYYEKKYNMFAGDYTKITHKWEMDKLKNSLSFGSVALFCQYCYVVDFDKNTFEIYKGFVKSPHTGERFSDMECEQAHRDNEYYPVTLIKIYYLDNLPTEEEFVKDLEADEDSD